MRIGESLFNDGTAYVLFLVFQDMVIGEGKSVGGIITSVIRLSVGGVALGLLIAVPVVFLLGRIYNDAPAEITGTMVSCYMTFWIAEAD